ncbi:hypothetical protein Tco_0360010 [Tanacetum coccineum]
MRRRESRAGLYLQGLVRLGVHYALSYALWPKIRGCKQNSGVGYYWPGHCTKIDGNHQEIEESTSQAHLKGQGSEILDVAIAYFYKMGSDAKPTCWQQLQENQVKKIYMGYYWYADSYYPGGKSYQVTIKQLPETIPIHRTGADRREFHSKGWVKTTETGSRKCRTCWAHYTIIKTSNGDTPFSLTYGTEAVIPVEIGMPSIRCAEVKHAENDEELLLNLDILVERREKAVVREARNKAKMEKYYNAKERGKLGPKWEGPYEVIEALGKGSYKSERKCRMYSAHVRRAPT